MSATATTRNTMILIVFALLSIPCRCIASPQAGSCSAYPMHPVHDPAMKDLSHGVAEDKLRNTPQSTHEVRRIEFAAEHRLSGSPVTLDSIRVSGGSARISLDTLLIGATELLVDIATGVDATLHDGAFMIMGNFANPFTSVTQFDVFAATSSSVTIMLYNLQGRRVASLQTSLLPGSSRFVLHAASLPAGMYFLEVVDHRGQRDLMKLMKTGMSSSGSVRFEYAGMTDAWDASMSKITEMLDLQVTGYAALYEEATLHVRITADTTITFVMDRIEYLLPVLETLPVSFITDTTAISGGIIASDGGCPVTERGVCWSSFPNPTIADDRTMDGDGIGSFESTISGLLPETDYYVRAYATNCVGTAYGNQVLFSTYPYVPDTRVAYIPAGSFRMGNITGHSAGSSTELPVHEVSLGAFLMWRTPVTQAEYESVMGTNPSRFSGDNHPVEQVPWFDAVAFCNELSKLENLDTCYVYTDDDIICDFTANGYRLPTEAEWEYACRAGTETDFHTGNLTHIYDSPLDSALNAAGWYRGNSDNTSHPVARKQPNAFGLYDMHGNVWEWCWDWFQNDYYATSPVENPKGAASGSTRVLRGASWYRYARFARSANRFSSLPEIVNPDYGFRVVRIF